jgi:hypothetical protein
MRFIGLVQMAFEKALDAEVRKLHICVQLPGRTYMLTVVP